MTDKIRFTIDREKKEITFYLKENQMREIVKEAIDKKVDTDIIARNITDICYLTTKKLCKELDMNFDTLKPNVIIERG